MKKPLDELLHEAPLPSKNAFIALEALIREHEQLQSAFGWVLQVATDRSLELRNFDLAREHAPVIMAKAQGICQGLELSINMILTQIHEASQLEEQDETPAPDEE